MLAVFAATGYAQNADDICGIFHSKDPFSKEGSQCEIYKASDGTYEAKVVWVENPKKKNQLGLVFMKGLTYNAKDKEYQNGKIQYPGKKGTYKAFIRNCMQLCPRQALHAKTLGFIHPVTDKELNFDSPVADDMMALINKWRKKVQQ